SVWVVARDYASNETQLVKSFAILGEQSLGHIGSPTEGELTRQSVTDVAGQIESPAGIASAHATSMSVTACDASTASSYFDPLLQLQGDGLYHGTVPLWEGSNL